MATEISFGLFNYENGGRQSDGSYDLSGLQEAFSSEDIEAPDIIMINEAKGWRRDGNIMLHAAANALSRQLQRPYAPEIGQGIRGDATTPALLYDPRVVRLDFWGDESALNNDKINYGKMRTVGRKAAQFCVSIQHWHPGDGWLRTIEAHETKAIVTGPPTLLAGDLNNSASGPHVDMDWTKAPDHLRGSKAILLPNGEYAADTTAMDLMLGDWDWEDGYRTRQVQALARQAIGWNALAELAYYSGTPPEEAFKPTVNKSDEDGGGLLIDWMLVNDAWREGLVPHTYRVHEPLDPTKPPSDHRLVTATMEI